MGNPDAALRVHRHAIGRAPCVRKFEENFTRAEVAIVMQGKAIDQPLALSV
jgi:hypothetical protein